MSDPVRPTRRGFLAATAGLAAAAGSGVAAAAATETETGAANAASVEPFWGRHQSGIITKPQGHSYFLAFDLTTEKRDELRALLAAWTDAAARMTSGLPIKPFKETDYAAGASNVTDMAVTTTPVEAPDYGAAVTAKVDAPDSGEAIGLSPSRLTVTFGFGPGLFVKDGKDRYGLASRRPAALVDLPTFVGDQLQPARTGGDLSIQACADDPQVAFHAARQLARIAYDAAQVRWAQSGFLPAEAKGTPRNLMGFKDGTDNPLTSDAKAMDEVVWVGAEGPGWMQGGSYLVARRVRIALEHWDRMKVAFQESTVGRHKETGAPLGGKTEFEPVDLNAKGADGNPLIPENAHVRLAAAQSNSGARILRRGYSYNDGVNFTAERWPPWRQGMEYDAGLFFLCYQRDPRTGFIKIFERMAKLDMMNQFVTHVGGGIFACPSGAAQGEFIGQRLFA
jgi:deferrochelatase/peroxidase EfeB